MSRICISATAHWPDAESIAADALVPCTLALTDSCLHDADNICETAKVGLNEMLVQSKGAHDFVLETLNPSAKTTFKFPLYNQTPAKNDQPVVR